MFIIKDGKKRRFTGAFLGERRITEIWEGSKKMWPITDGVAKRIMLELPKKGTREWQYWVHAIDAVSTKSTQDNYMRVIYGELPFYIQNSPDGSVPYELNNSYLTLDYGEGIPIDSIGEAMEVEAVIKEREGKHIKIGQYVKHTEMNWDLPMLAGTKIGASVKGGGKRAVYAMFGEMKTLPSGYTWNINTGANRNVWAPRTKAVGEESEIAETDTSISATGYISGSATINTTYYPVWPKFNRVFKLKVISVE
jgi:hypothetical protein